MPSCKLKEPVIRNCALCGKRTTFTSANQKYCKACAKEMTNKQSLKYSHDTYHKKKKKPPIEPRKSIDDIVHFAMKQGISYGKAVRLLEG